MRRTWKPQLAGDDVLPQQVTWLSPPLVASAITLTVNSHHSRFSACFENLKQIYGKLADKGRQPMLSRPSFPAGRILFLHLRVQVKQFLLPCWWEGRRSGATLSTPETA